MIEEQGPPDPYTLRRQLEQNHLRALLHWAQAWIQTWKDLGYPIGGQWKEMSGADMISPEDEYIELIFKPFCTFGCVFYPERHVTEIWIGVPRSSNLRTCITKRDSPRSYFISEVSRDGRDEIKGHTWWECETDIVNQDDIEAITLDRIGKHGCAHLKMMLEPVKDEAQFDWLLKMNLMKSGDGSIVF